MTMDKENLDKHIYTTILALSNLELQVEWVIHSSKNLTLSFWKCTD